VTSYKRVRAACRRRRHPLEESERVYSLLI
jgi:hypothetical protein